MLRILQGRLELVVSRLSWWRSRLSHKPPRAFLIAAGVAVALLLIGLLSIAPIVRARAAREADKRRLEIEIGSVRPGFFAVSLREVRVRPRGAPGLEARLDVVRIELGATLSVRSVQARGGAISIEGEPDDLSTRLRELRHPDEATPASPSRSRIPLQAENLSFSWRIPSGGELVGAGIRGSREGDRTKLSCNKCSARHRRFAVDLANAELELGPDSTLRQMTVGTLAMTHESAPAPSSAGPATSATAEPAPPPLPALPTRGGKERDKAKATEPAAPNGPVLPLPDLHALRARLATAMAILTPRLSDGGKIEIAGLSAKLDIDAEHVALGPGWFQVDRHGDRIHLAFASDAADKDSSGGTPLSIDADLPTGVGDMTARLAGGPVSLAALGVKEGMMNLSDVTHGSVSGKGQLVLSAPADALTFDGQVTLRSISMKQARIGPEPLRGIDLVISGRGLLTDAGHLRVDDAELDMGALHVRSHGTVEETPEHFALSLAIDVAPAACQALLDSSPQGLLPTVRSARMGGTFGATVNLAFDTRTIDKLLIDYKVSDQCKMLEVPVDLAKERFEGEFTYKIYHADGTAGDATTGPGTPTWTPLDEISPFMIAAVLTTEDGAFYKHHGFNHYAIRSSVLANLKARRFVRGASTITMQLAKNLFLARDKALSRKIEEVILTDYLEQIFRKDDMMELYLNVVEFGPDIYGIRQAAEYYFGRRPEELNLAECFFLATLLPSPVRYSKLKDKGEVSETWMRHLKALMEIAARNGKITRAELEEARDQHVVFLRQGDPRPLPRKPVAPRRRDSIDDDDAAWRSLD